MVDYEAIKEKNIRDYGAKIGKIGALLLANSYSDRSHFIYELLQNAEDACERLRSQGDERSFSVSFTLFPDRLEFRHNGIPFNERDVEGICGISEDIKSEYEHQIGKFGIGFKSVFAYSKCPEIYSNDKTFRINNYVWPEGISLRDDVEGGETLIVIHFHKIDLPFLEEVVTPEIAYEEIGKKLSRLGLRTLLFTRNISKIHWMNGERHGQYSRVTEQKDGYKKITLTSEDEEPENWLVFEKDVSTEEKEAVVEIGYKLALDKDRKEHIDAVRNSELVVYFPTGKGTRLQFLIQGPYNTTPTREDIRKNDSWNERLISETGGLVSESLKQIKQIGLLDIECLSVMPLNEELFTTESGLTFHPICEQVKAALKTEELLPTSDGGHASKKETVISRSNELIELLSNEQLAILFGKSYWLDSRVKQSSPRWRELWEYLTGSIEIEEIRPEHFATKVTEQFLIEQTDDWMIAFYGALLNWRALWSEETIVSDFKMYDSLRVKPIIRLEDEDETHRHVVPFGEGGKPNVFMPPSDEVIKKNISGYFNNRVKSSIMADEKAREFLKKLGLREPDAISAIYEYILPKYRGPYNKEWEPGEEEDELGVVSLDENKTDLERVVKAMEKFSSDSRMKELISDLQKTKILYCRNMADGERYYCSSEDTVYLDSKYTGDKAVDVFFEGNEDIWVLEETYLDLMDVEFLKKLGCETKIQVDYRTPRYGEYVVLRDSYGWHKRGIKAFDPDCEIEGLEWALENINYEKSLIIWKILRSHYTLIKGRVEEATRQEYSNAKIYPIQSKMGGVLMETPWLYAEGAEDPIRPSEIMVNELGPDYECPEANVIAEQLGLKTPRGEEFKDKMSEDEWEWFKARDEFEKLGKTKEALELLKKLKEKERIEPVEEGPIDISKELEEELKKNARNYDENGPPDEVIVGPTPEEEEKIEEENGKQLTKILKKIKIKKEVKSYVASKTLKTIDVDQFLMAEYSGHCQICNTRLYSGNSLSKRRGLKFVTTRIIEIRNEKAYANMEWNVICLCPNHFTLFKYGPRALNGIWELATEVINKDYAPVFVEERGKTDYYITKIKMMTENGIMEETELYYSPTHMRKIVALLKEGNKTE